MSIRYPKLLITGGSGLLGMNWACAMRDEWEVILGTHRHQVELAGVTTMRLEWESDDRLADQVKDLAPDLIVHTAGWTDVDACEVNPSRAQSVNAGLARLIAMIAAKSDIPLVHISTDHLFNEGVGLFSERDRTEPVNEYARSKLKAEEEVLKYCPKALVVRTNFFGWGHSRRESLTDWILRELRKNRRLDMFEDVYFTPILADRLVVAVHELVARKTLGIVNVAGDERISKFDFARKIARVFELPEHLVVRSRLQDKHLVARRPHNMALDNRTACRLLGEELGSVDEYLEELQAQESTGRKTELLAANSAAAKELDCKQ